MRARALLIETLVGIASAAVAAGAFCWMVKYTVLKEADMIVIEEHVKLGSGQTLVPGGICWDACRQAARTRAIQRPYACYADAFGRPGGMEEDLYNG